MQMRFSAMPKPCLLTRTFSFLTALSLFLPHPVFALKTVATFEGAGLEELDSKLRFSGSPAAPITIQTAGTEETVEGMVKRWGRSSGPITIEQVERLLGAILREGEESDSRNPYTWEEARSQMEDLIRWLNTPAGARTSLGKSSGYSAEFEMFIGSFERKELDANDAVAHAALVSWALGKFAIFHGGNHRTGWALMNIALLRSATIQEPLVWESGKENLYYETLRKFDLPEFVALIRTYLPASTGAEETLQAMADKLKQSAGFVFVSGRASGYSEFGTGKQIAKFASQAAARGPTPKIGIRPFDSLGLDVMEELRLQRPDQLIGVAIDKAGQVPAVLEVAKKRDLIISVPAGETAGVIEEVEKAGLSGKVLVIAKVTTFAQAEEAAGAGAHGIEVEPANEDLLRQLAANRETLGLLVLGAAGGVDQANVQTLLSLADYVGFSVDPGTLEAKLKWHQQALQQTRSAGAEERGTEGISRPADRWLPVTEAVERLWVEWAPEAEMQNAGYYLEGSGTAFLMPLAVLEAEGILSTNSFAAIVETPEDKERLLDLMEGYSDVLGLIRDRVFVVQDDERKGDRKQKYESAKADAQRLLFGTDIHTIDRLERDWLLQLNTILSRFGYRLPFDFSVQRAARSLLEAA